VRNLFCSTYGVALAHFLAYCSHPAAAWRRLSGKGRVLLLATYAASSYVLTLAVLMMG
jgi:hypothetical protein